MGAVPKNKITRAERGKRRSGNRPGLKKNLGHANVPMHKQGLVAQIFHTIGLTSPVSTRVTKQRTKKSSQAAENKKTSTKQQIQQTSNKSAKQQPSKAQSAQVKAQQQPSRQVQDRG